jgi:ankyrin repeat protein
LFQTAASHLSGNGSSELLLLLVKVPELDINKPDNEGNTPLHFAAQAGKYLICCFIVNYYLINKPDPTSAIYKGAKEQVFNNQTLHKDLNIPFIRDQAVTSYNRFHKKLQNHPSNLFPSKSPS